MSENDPETRTITLTVEDAEFLVRKVESLESVLRELVEHFGMRCERRDHSDASRMLMTLREEDIGEWLREKLGG